MKITVAAIVPLALVACSPLELLPAEAGLTRAANPELIHAPAQSGPGVVYAGYRVIEPGDWRGVNDAQSGN